jgi:DNA-binding transcriptional ArsR family regulator
LRNGFADLVSARQAVAELGGSYASTSANFLVNLPKVTYALRTVHVLDALGNPVRRAILHELRAGSLSVGEIAVRLPVSRPAVSRHLRVLEDAGLVQVREEGTRNIYSIHMRGFASVRAFVDEFWDTALARLEKLARR